MARSGRARRWQIDAAERILRRFAVRWQVDSAAVVASPAEVERTEAAPAAPATEATTSAGRYGWEIDAAALRAAEVERPEAAWLGSSWNDRKIDLAPAKPTAARLCLDVEIDLPERCSVARLRAWQRASPLMTRRSSRGQVDAGPFTRRVESWRRGHRRRRMLRPWLRQRWSCSRSYRAFLARTRHEQARAALRASHFESGRRNAAFVDLIGRVAAVALDLDHRPVFSSLGTQMYHASAPLKVC